MLTFLTVTAIRVIEFSGITMPEMIPLINAYKLIWEKKIRK